MRVTSVELHPEGSSDICVLSFRDPRRLNPYNVKAIIGLDANEIIPRYYGGSGNTKFYNLALEKRELVVRVELNPNFKLNESYSSLRDAVYRMISSSRTGVIQVQFKDGETVVAAISGFVSKMEAPHFNKTQEVQLTIQCSDPLLRAPIPVAVDITGLDPATTVIEDVFSTAPHGFEFDVTFVAAATEFTIGDAGWEFKVSPTGGFQVGDILHLSSEHNAKQVYLTRSAVVTHLADKVTPGSIWPVLFPGENTFALSTPTDLSWTAISHRPAYWGV